MYFYAIQLSDCNCKYFCSFLLLFLLIPSVKAQEQVKIEEEKIEITQAQDRLDEIGQTTIIVTAQRENFNDVKALSTDLRSGQGDWIEKSKVKVSPQQFDLVRGQPLELLVTFEGLNEGPNVYSGNLLLASPNLITVKIPITISIHANPLIALSIVGLGVIVSFVFKFLLLKVKDKDEAATLLGINKRVHDEIRSRSTPRLTDGNYNNSLTDKAEGTLLAAIKDFNDGYFHESIRKGKESLELITRISVDTSQPNLQQILPNPQLKKERLLFTRPIRGDYAAFAGVTLGLLISVLLVWQLYFPQLSTFGVFPIDYIAAFLFGFGSQAILINELLDFARRIWSA
jgi:hypothetical protein